ncbi:hypothetical protein BY996DRAFT_6578367 [Phakopsora pachyrhizi]|nr:hypothetical protein BY996DRAFT_6578367 [Phakopsora pachyrhizi]
MEGILTSFETRSGSLGDLHVCCWEHQEVGVEVVKTIHNKVEMTRWVDVLEVHNFNFHRRREAFVINSWESRRKLTRPTPLYVLSNFLDKGGNEGVVESVGSRGVEAHWKVDRGRMHQGESAGQQVMEVERPGSRTLESQQLISQIQEDQLQPFDYQTTKELKSMKERKPTFEFVLDDYASATDVVPWTIWEDNKTLRNERTSGKREKTVLRIEKEGDRQPGKGALRIRKKKRKKEKERWYDYGPGLSQSRDAGAA